MKLHEKIYYYRKRAKLSQEELAAQVGVSRQAVSKWELGEATPEVEKLLALARAFGVTTDELLSEEGPEQADADASPSSGPDRPAGAAPDYFDRTTGLLGRLVRRYGWLAGVYVALSGLGITLVGALARFAFGKMFSDSLNMFNSFDGGGWSIEMSPGFQGSASDVSDLLGLPGSNVTALTDMGQVFVAIATVILVVGVCVMIAGAILAFYLYQRGRKNS